MNIKNGNTINTNIKYTIVLNVPNSTHGYSAVSLPRYPRKTKLRVKNQKKARYDSSKTFDIPTPQSIIGNK